ncbi:MAG: glycosyltransferase family 2 protein [Deltaproteobacteria bacterium]|nr:glycosyltransferase family 2 protein [Deltaproteobacteria bacterium]
MKSPSASIIVTCFNLGQYIEKALVSAFASRNCDFEVIVVDDGSTDAQTLAILEKIAVQYNEQPLTLIKQPNMGLPAARNVGIKKAVGEYILPLDADNMIRPDYLCKAINVLQNNPDVGVVHANAQYFGNKSGPWIFKEFDIHELMLGNKIDACSVFRRKVWEDCGGYDEALFRIGYEDWDFWLSAYECGWKFYWLNEILFDYCVRDDSMVQKCALPENYTKLVSSIREKHSRLYKKYWPEEFLSLKTLSGIRKMKWLNYIGLWCHHKKR